MGSFSFPPYERCGRAAMAKADCCILWGAFPHITERELGGRSGGGYWGGGKHRVHLHMQSCNSCGSQGQRGGTLTPDDGQRPTIDHLVASTGWGGVGGVSRVVVGVKSRKVGNKDTVREVLAGGLLVSVAFFICARFCCVLHFLW